MLTVLSFLAISSSFSVWCAAKLGKRYEQTLPIANMAIVALLFVFGVLEQTLLGVYTIIAVSGGLYIWTLVYTIRKNSWKKMLNNLATPGMFFYLGLAVILAVLNNGRLLHRWDEFSHWGDSVKVMVQFDALPATAHAFSAYSSYPPGITLFQYFFYKTAELVTPGSGFVEAYCFTSNQLLSYSMLLPFTTDLCRKKGWLIPVYAVVLLLAPMMFHNLLAFALSDGYISILSGVGLYMIFRTRKEAQDWVFHWFIALCCVMLVLAKDAALLFAFALACAYCFSAEGSGLARFVRRAWIFAAVLVPKLIWAMLVSHYGAKAPVAGEISFGAFVKMLTGNDPENRMGRLAAFAEGLFENLIPFGNTGLSFSPAFFLFFAFAVLFGVCWLMHDEKDSEKQTNTVHCLVAVIAAIQAIVFIIGMCFAYLFKMTAEEALELTSFDRYFGSALLPIFLIVILALLQYVEDRISWNFVRTVTVLCLLLMIFPTRPVVAYVSRSYITSGNSERAMFRPMAEKIIDVCEPGSRIWYISQGCNGEGFWKVKFMVRPCLVTNVNAWSLNIPIYDDLSYTTDIPMEQWQAELVECYDYVALQVIDDYFLQTYGTLFENPSDIREGEVYRVDKQSGKMVLCD